MDETGTKAAAESVLRELPSVVGAYVREDGQGKPREIHLLISAGPQPRHFARDVKELLEERLGIPIDQRVISIAQLAGASATPDDASRVDFGADSPQVRALVEEATDPGPPDTSVRIRFVSSQCEVNHGRITVRVVLDLDGTEHGAEATELEVGNGRVRAGGAAALRAATQACGGSGRFELDAASLVRVMEREYALVSAVATSAHLGRQPAILAGAQQVETFSEIAAALAALKSVNRVLGLMVHMAAAEAHASPRALRPR
jgi:hypothetical protein